MWFIAAARDRLDDLRMRGIDLDLLAQAADQIVDRAIENFGLAPAHQVEQPVTAHHLPRMAHQRVEQMIFARRQRNLIALAVNEHPLNLAQHPIGERIAGAARIKRAPALLPQTTQTLPARPDPATG